MEGDGKREQKMEKKKKGQETKKESIENLI